MLDVRKKYNKAIFDLEKAKETIIMLQTDNKTLSELAKQNKKISHSTNENVKISQEEKDSPLMESLQVNSLEKQIGDLKKENVVLKKENGVLNARMKQIQSSIKMNKDRFGHDYRDESSEKEEEEFEVDKILKHKINKSGRKFLVHWKAYGPQYDSWIDEKDLNCPKILKAYLKMKKI